MLAEMLTLAQVGYNCSPGTAASLRYRRQRDSLHLMTTWQLLCDLFATSSRKRHHPRIFLENVWQTKRQNRRGENAKGAVLRGWPPSRCPMSSPPEFDIEIRGDRDIVISKPDEGFEVTYRRDVHHPMLIADDLLQNDFDESKTKLLAQAWKVALKTAKSLGWLDDPKQKRKRAHPAA